MQKQLLLLRAFGLPMPFAKGQLDSGSVLIYQLGCVFCIAIKFCLHNGNPCISTGISKIQIALAVLNVIVSSHQMTCRNDQHLQNSDLLTVSTVKWYYGRKNTSGRPFKIKSLGGTIIPIVRGVYV